MMLPSLAFVNDSLLSDVMCWSFISMDMDLIAVVLLRPAQSSERNCLNIFPPHNIYMYLNINVSMEWNWRNYKHFLCSILLHNATREFNSDSAKVGRFQLLMSKISSEIQLASQQHPARLDYTRFEAAETNKTTAEFIINNWTFFITFHVHTRARSLDWKKRAALCEHCGIIAEDNKWVSSLMRSFDTQSRAERTSKPGHLLWAV